MASFRKFMSQVASRLPAGKNSSNNNSFNNDDSVHGRHAAMVSQSTKPLQRHVPTTLDLHYITERILVGAQPSEAPLPTYLDRGRDSGFWDHHHQNHNSSLRGSGSGGFRQFLQLGDNSVHGDKSERSSSLHSRQQQQQQQQQAAGEDSTQQRRIRPIDSSPLTMDNKSERRYPFLNRQLQQDPSTISTLSSPSTAATGTAAAATTPSSTALPSPTPAAASSMPPLHPNTPTNPAGASGAAGAGAGASSNLKKPGNSPGTLSTFLEQRHANHFLAFHLSDTPADDRTLLLLHRQIVRCPWLSPGKRPWHSETPCVPQVLEICYAMQAFLSLRPENVAVVYCSNGNTRTAIVVACYLKLVGQVATCQQGFLLFCQQRHLPVPVVKHHQQHSHSVLSSPSSPSPSSPLPTTTTATATPPLTSPYMPIWDTLPASLQAFFQNFDHVIDFGTYRYDKPLLLRAIAIQGCPVEDKPVLDIWNAQQEHVFSSYSETEDERCPTSQWAEEEGFYQVNAMVEGDFCLSCRFGGIYAPPPIVTSSSSSPTNSSSPPRDHDSWDVTKLLFRYVNSTAFLASGPYELGKSQVDVMRRYAPSFEDDFLITLLWESHVENVPNAKSDEQEVQLHAQLLQPCSDRILTPILTGTAALEKGLQLLRHYHSAHPVEEDVQVVVEHYQEQQQLEQQLLLQMEEQQHQLELLSDASMSGGGMMSLSTSSHGSSRYQQQQPPQPPPPPPVEVDLNTIPRSWILLALQLSNFDQDKTWDLLFHPKVMNIWKSESTSSSAAAAAAGSASADADATITTHTTTTTITTTVSSKAGADASSSSSTTTTTTSKTTSSSLLSSSTKAEQQQQQQDRADAQQVLKLMEDGGDLEVIEEKIDLGEASEDDEPEPKRQPLHVNNKSSDDRDHDHGTATTTTSSRATTTTTPADGTATSTTAVATPGKINSSSSNNAAAAGADVGSMYSPMMTPQRGDVINAFGEYYRDHIHHHQQQQQQYPYFSPQAGDPRPVFAMHPTTPDTSSSGAISQANGEMSGPIPPNIFHPNNPEFAKAMELLLQLSHTGVTVTDLLDLLQNSKQWSASGQKRPQEGGGDGDGGSAADPAAATAANQGNLESNAHDVVVGTPQATPQKPSEGVVSPTRQSSPPKKEEEPVPEDQQPAAADTAETTDVAKLPLGEHPEYAKYFKMLKMGMAREQVEHALKRDSKDPTIIDLDPTKSLEAQRGSSEGGSGSSEDPPLKDDPEYGKYFKMLKMGMGQEQVEHALKRDGKDPLIAFLDPNKSLKSQMPSDDNNKENDAPPLKDDPEFTKYFKMLKMGMPREQVEHALRRDGKETFFLDLDPEKSLASQLKTQSSPADDGPPLKEDPEYSKYFKMLKMGMPREQVEHALRRDGKDTLVLDLDPEKSLASQQKQSPAAVDNGPPLKEDPEYAKYFKMLKMGMAREQVEHALRRDGKDTAILDLDPEKSLASQQQKPAVDDGPPLKDDPEYSKYFKMLKMGMAKEQIEHALKRDGKDPSIASLDPEKSLKSQTGGGNVVDDGPPLKDDPEYSKYFKMLKMGMPVEQIEHAMKRDGKDPAIASLDPEKSLKSQTGQAADNFPPLKNNPEYEKYFKMLSMGLPKGAVQNALLRDGKDPSIMDLDPNKSLESQTGGGGKDTGIPLKDDPEYTKYFKMMSMGLPIDAVRNALQRDGKDPAIMDLDPNKSVAYQMQNRGGRPAAVAKKPKKRVRRKKIYWKPLDSGQIKKDSLWTMVQGTVTMENLTFDPKEFEDLFTESADPAEQKKKKAAADSAASKKKKTVEIISGKRSMNGGIILARLKVEYAQIARVVDKMEHGKFDSTEIGSLKEFLPADDERKAFEAFLQDKKTEEERNAAIADLSECEKYMIAMLNVPNAEAKFDCLHFRAQFKSRLEDLTQGIRLVDRACDEVRNSQRLRKVMAMILTLVNEINTGGEGNEAAGFGLDALLKLNEAKAFDKKTSVLQYLVKLVRENDRTLLEFSADMPSVDTAESVVLDSLLNEMTQLRAELTRIHATVEEEAARLEAAGELQPPSLTDLKQQRTSIQFIEEVPQYNQIQFSSGRTSMERFMLQAAAVVEIEQTNINAVKEKYLKLLEYFVEDESMPSSDFFGTIRKFVLEFKKAADEVERVEKAREREKMRAAAKSAKQSKTPKKGSPGRRPNIDRMQSMSVLGNQNSFDSEQSPDSRAAMNLVRHKSFMGIKELEDESADQPDSPIDIAALAAIAAAKKQRNATGVAHSDKVHGKESETSADDAKSDVPNNIAALAAAAAMKKRQDTAPASAIGGIAALAAQAAQRKQAESESEPAAGGIAALAAQAALKKQKEATSSVQMGGIAALAAQAALKKQLTNDSSESAEIRDDTESTSSSPPVGGIAALAAQAALKKRNASASVQPAGGIAALAAEAALRKAQDFSDRQSQASETIPSEPTSQSDTSLSTPVQVGGIAALAAQAALKRRSASATELPAGGIAALAAQAALRKRQDIEPAVSEPTSQSEASTSESSSQTGGGIAALAAQAALKRQSATAHMQPEGGIAALAAQAALRKQQSIAHRQAPNEENTPESTAESETSNPHPSSPPTVGGIAALAAQAALKRRSSAAPAPPVGGIAALAAQAALRKRQDIETAASEPTSQSEASTSESSSQTGGGIAALAAQAALKRQRAATLTQPEGGIAALAAQAALRKQQEFAHRQAQSIEVEQSEPTSESETSFSGPSSSPPAVGGIAALAAQAALKRQSSAAPSPPVGGIAALAAQAALNRRIAASPAPPAGGIAALAAQAALKKQQEMSQRPSDQTDASLGESPDSSSPPAHGGIAALAAQAALKRRMSAAPAPPVGGIAALAAQAALRKQHDTTERETWSSEARQPEVTTKSETSTPTPPPGMGGIAALAAQAALKRRSSAAPAPPVGGIAALAAQAALKKQQASLEQPSESVQLESVVDSETSTSNNTSSPPAVAGIAALAAQAALKRQSAAAPALPEGGIAALAAQAALKKQQGVGERVADQAESTLADSVTLSSSPPAVGGIAALAAQAALKRQSAAAPALPEGGIAALAAQAALKKQQGVGERVADQAESTLADSIALSSSPPAVGGIAALAAQAALKRQSAAAPALPEGGIAALAAQAALRRHQGVAGRLADQAESTLVDSITLSSSPPTVGGIAALAAQAALKRQSAAAPALPEGGIAALAAQAALKKQHESLLADSKSSNPSPPVVGGIAALAAQAALSEGGIAASAAQAALKRQQEMAEGDAKVHEPESNYASGEETAVQATLKKQSAADSTLQEGDIGVQLALRKQQDIAEPHVQHNESSQPKSTAEPETSKSTQSVRRIAAPAPEAGGIAALAAQSALRKQQVMAERDAHLCVSFLPASSGVSEASIQIATGPLPPVEGIAALTAQDTAERQADQSEELLADSEILSSISSSVAVAGVAVLATQPALEMRSVAFTSPPEGEFSSHAPQAAIEKNQDSAEHQGDQPESFLAEPGTSATFSSSSPTVGGIAALAAQAARKRRSSAVPAPAVEGIAVLPEQAAFIKQQNIAERVAQPNEVDQREWTAESETSQAAAQPESFLPESETPASNGSSPAAVEGITSQAVLTWRSEPSPAVEVTLRKDHDMQDCPGQPSAGIEPELVAQSESSSLNLPSPPAVGVIEGVAAQAALKRQSSTSPALLEGTVALTAHPTLTKQQGTAERQLQLSDAAQPHSVAVSLQPESASQAESLVSNPSPPAVFGEVAAQGAAPPLESNAQSVATELVSSDAGGTEDCADGYAPKKPSAAASPSGGEVTDNAAQEASQGRAESQPIKESLSDVTVQSDTAAPASPIGKGDVESAVQTAFDMGSTTAHPELGITVPGVQSIESVTEQGQQRSNEAHNITDGCVTAEQDKTWKRRGVYNVRDMAALASGLQMPASPKSSDTASCMESEGSCLLGTECDEGVTGNSCAVRSTENNVFQNDGQPLCDNIVVDEGDETTSQPRLVSASSMLQRVPTSSSIGKVDAALAEGEMELTVPHVALKRHSSAPQGQDLACLPANAIPKDEISPPSGSNGRIQMNRRNSDSGADLSAIASGVAVAMQTESLLAASRASINAIQQQIASLKPPSNHESLTAKHVGVASSATLQEKVAAIGKSRQTNLSPVYPTTTHKKSFRMEDLDLVPTSPDTARAVAAIAMATKVKEQRKITRQGHKEKEMTDSSNESGVNVWKSDLVESIQNPKLRSVTLRGQAAVNDSADAAASNANVAPVDRQDKARALAALAVAARVQHRVALKEAQSGSGRQVLVGQSGEEIALDDKTMFPFGGDDNLLNFEGLDSDDLSCDTASSEKRARAALAMAAKLKEKRKLMRKAKKAAKKSAPAKENPSSSKKDGPVISKPEVTANEVTQTAGSGDVIDEKFPGNETKPTSSLIKIRKPKDSDLRSIEGIEPTVAGDQQMDTSSKSVSDVESADPETVRTKVVRTKGAKKERKRSLSVSDMNPVLAQVDLLQTHSPMKPTKSKPKAVKKSSSTSDLSTLSLTNESELSKVFGASNEMTHRDLEVTKSFDSGSVLSPVDSKSVSPDKSRALAALAMASKLKEKRRKTGISLDPGTGKHFDQRNLLGATTVSVENEYPQSAASGESKGAVIVDSSFSSSKLPEESTDGVRNTPKGKMGKSPISSSEDDADEQSAKSLISPSGSMDSVDKARALATLAMASKLKEKKRKAAAINVAKSELKESSVDKVADRKPGKVATSKKIVRLEVPASEGEVTRSTDSSGIMLGDAKSPKVKKAKAAKKANDSDAEALDDVSEESRSHASEESKKSLPKKKLRVTSPKSDSSRKPSISDTKKSKQLGSSSVQSPLPRTISEGEADSELNLQTVGETVRERAITALATKMIEQRKLKPEEKKRRPKSLDSAEVAALLDDSSARNAEAARFTAVKQVTKEKKKRSLSMSDLSSFAIPILPPPLLEISKSPSMDESSESGSPSRRARPKPVSPLSRAIQRRHSIGLSSSASSSPTSAERKSRAKLWLSNLFHK